MNVSCVQSANQDVLMVYQGNMWIGTVLLLVDEPSLMLFGQPNPHILTFNDWEIIMDNWNQMQEMRAVARAERIAKIVQERLDSPVGK